MRASWRNSSSSQPLVAASWNIAWNSVECIVGTLSCTHFWLNRCGTSKIATRRLYTCAARVSLGISGRDAALDHGFGRAEMSCRPGTVSGHGPWALRRMAERGYPLCGVRHHGLRRVERLDRHHDGHGHGHNTYFDGDTARYHLALRLDDRGAGYHA
jgi:hypothetical protein